MFFIGNVNKIAGEAGALSPSQRCFFEERGIRVKPHKVYNSTLHLTGGCLFESAT